MESPNDLTTDVNDARGGATSSRPWFWEGNVQASACAYLERNGWSITGQAHTATKAHGKDIEAVRDGQRLWGNAEGVSEGTPRTNPNTQAQHWFARAMFDLILFRSLNAEVDLAAAPPDYRTYRNLLERVEWFQATSRFSTIWVSDNDVKEQMPPPMRT